MKKARKRQVDGLGLGLVAIKVDAGVFIKWRLRSNDSDNVMYNIYRDGALITDKPVYLTNFTDSEGALKSVYVVKTVIKGKEVEESKAVCVWSEQYLEIPLEAPRDFYSNIGYTPGMCSVADLDGDGEYEVILRWNPNDMVDPNIGGMERPSGNTFIDAYKLNGKRLWRIDMGRNIRANLHDLMFLAFDFNGSGKAQVALKTADGTIDGVGNVIGDASVDWMLVPRKHDKHMSHKNLYGPLYLTVFDGETGEALDTVPYDPQTTVANDELLNTLENRTETGRIVDDHTYWGDIQGNRCDRYNACVAYLDGERPSMVFQRGMFPPRKERYIGTGRITVVAYNFTKDNKIEKVWRFDTFDPAGGEEQIKPELADILGKCTHDMVAGDVDGSGRDSIILGNVAIKYDGTLLWFNAGKRHGDFMHLGKFIANRAGLELFVASDNKAELLDAGTGQVIDGLERTYEDELQWGNIGVFGDKATMLTQPANYDTSNANVRAPIGCYRIYWDEQLHEQLMGGDANGEITISNLVNNKRFETKGCEAIYRPYRAPNGIADIFGDWREEFITRTPDNKALRIYTTVSPTQHRVTTFMHDPLYRNGVANQNTAIAMPPRIGFYLAEEAGKEKLGKK